MMSASKLTAIGRLLDQEHANDPISLPISREQYLDLTFIPRLSFRHSPRMPTKVKELAEYLAQHADHALFIDTNLTWLDKEWWEELLSVPGRVHLTGRVLRELVPYLQRNPKHPLRAALADSHPAIVLHPDPDDDIWQKCFAYYVALLIYRRRLLESSIERFKRQNAREPSADDQVELKMKLQRAFGERTLRLNLKPPSPQRTDEALVFQAVYHAITTGQRTKIFSGDSDVEEQYYVMIRLLTAHYYGLLLGRRYAADFARFNPRPLPSSLVSRYDKLFEPHNATIIDLGGRLIQDYIPEYTTFVPITCATIGKEYTSEVTYGAETTMAQVFSAKARTLGLSTDQLAGRNVHAWMVPEEFQLPDSIGALVAFDRSITLPDTGMRLAQLDIMNTMWPGDPHARVTPPDEQKSGAGGSSVFVPPAGARGILTVQARRPTPARLNPRSPSSRAPGVIRLRTTR